MLHGITHGKTCQRQRRMSEGARGVGSAHSTPRTGKPAARLAQPGSADTGKGLK
jgi:hypothetical protein